MIQRTLAHRVLGCAFRMRKIVSYPQAPASGGPFAVRNGGLLTLCLLCTGLAGCAGESPQTNDSEGGIAATATDGASDSPLTNTSLTPTQPPAAVTEPVGGPSGVPMPANTSMPVNTAPVDSTAAGGAPAPDADVPPLNEPTPPDDAVLDSDAGAGLGPDLETGAPAGGPDGTGAVTGMGSEGGVEAGGGAGGVGSGNPGPEQDAGTSGMPGGADGTEQPEPSDDGCPKSGNVTYEFNDLAAWPSDAVEKLAPALDEALYYYNCYSDLSHTLTINYKPSVQTAEANVDGWISFGTDRNYMVTATVMHEIGHTMGVGYSPWSELLQDGRWIGQHVVELMASIPAQERDSGYGERDYITADSLHFWPYGLNYASEHESEWSLINHVRIVEAMNRDKDDYRGR